jgi:hypothetical protein
MRHNENDGHTTKVLYHFRKDVVELGVSFAHAQIS